MNQSDKKLLLKDLCARVVYDNIIINVKGLGDVFLGSVDCFGEIGIRDLNNDLYKIDDVRPYLRPMTSMTEDEAVFLNGLVYNKESVFTSPVPIYVVNESDMDKYIDYCNEHCLDWRHLIEKGLAIEAHKVMYKRYERD